MTNAKAAPIAREGIIADFKMLSEQAEASGNRAAALRALKLAWRIERFVRQIQFRRP